jgi:hypothetical protein
VQAKATETYTSPAFVTAQAWSKPAHTDTPDDAGGSATWLGYLGAGSACEKECVVMCACVYAVVVCDACVREGATADQSVFKL